jgi:GntR family transcriptional regulator
VVRELRPRAALYRLLAERLRNEILAGRWKLGEQLPTESQLVEDSQVSRATVRQALSILEHEGFLVTRHGSGRYVSRPDALVSGGIEELKSLTTTIAEQGHVPGMRYVEKNVRPATPFEANLLAIDESDDVLELKREITADERVVAFSHDVIPMSILPPDFAAEALQGSVFAFLEEKCGIVAKTANATVRAESDGAGGMKLDGEYDPLFVLLDQTHFSEAGYPFMHSKTRFIEGRFNFFVVRTR